MTVRSIAVSGPPRNTSMNETGQSRFIIEASLPSIVTSIACPETFRVPSQTASTVVEVRPSPFRVSEFLAARFRRVECTTRLSKELCGRGRREKLQICSGGYRIWSLQKVVTVNWIGLSPFSVTRGGSGWALRSRSRIGTLWMNELENGDKCV